MSLSRIRDVRLTLKSALIASTVTLYLGVAIICGVATVIALDRTLVGQVDQQLDTYFVHLPGPESAVPASPLENDRGGRGPGNEGLRLVVSDSNVVISNFATTTDNSRIALTTTQIAQLRGMGLSRAAATVDLGGRLGDYRVVAGRDLSDRATVVAGLPLANQSGVVHQMTLLTATFISAGFALVILGGLWLVRRNLRGLDRLATTATRVARLPLSEGEVDLKERVPAEDTDARTEVGRVGFAFNRMLDHVDNALKARYRSEERVRRFLADASHELRSPLASIRGYSELLRRTNNREDVYTSQALERIESEAVRMTTLVDDLLLLARLDAGSEIDLTVVDLSELIVTVVSDAHAASSNHTWRVSLPETPIEVVGDAARLHEVIANLLANARVHTPPGTTVTVSLHEAQHLVHLIVKDDGPGIPESLQPEVFRRFTRGDGSRNRSLGSTGLGLSIVSAVVEAHGGTVAVRSSSGNTEFEVIVPAEGPQPAARG